MYSTNSKTSSLNYNNNMKKDNDKKKGVKLTISEIKKLDKNNKLKENQIKKLSEHSKHHTKTHIKKMINLMVNDKMSFTKSHNETMKKVGK